MHYIRFLRPPSIIGEGRQKKLSIVFTVSTDLGDSLLTVEEPLKLSIGLLKEGDLEPPTFSFSKAVSWNPGARVIKDTIPVPDYRWVQVVVIDLANVAAIRFGQLATIPPESGGALRNPRIMPAWFDFETGNRPAGHTDVCLRKLRFSDLVPIEFEEEFGDSIARHVWDGGLAAVSFLTQVFEGDELAVSKMPCLRNLIRRDDSQPLNVLELGCGVGVLGVGLAAILSLTSDVPGKCHLLMTDVPDAEERALANIHSFQASQTRLGRIVPSMQYENLDWEDGRKGSFSDSVATRPWDLVILSDCTYNTDTIPALVETLSQLSSTIAARYQGSTAWRPLQVFLATKPRHSSEDAVFEILHSHGWLVREKAVIELHSLPDKSEEVQFYLLAMK